jgi:hypothetical protein
MPDLRHAPSFAEQTLGGLIRRSVHDFDRDLAVQFDVVRQKDGAHPASAQTPQDVISTETSVTPLTLNLLPYPVWYCVKRRDPNGFLVAYSKLRAD